MCVCVCVCVHFLFCLLFSQLSLITFTSEKQPVNNLLKCKVYANVDTRGCRAEVIAELSPRLKAMNDLYSCWSDDEILHTLISILKVSMSILSVFRNFVSPLATV